MNKSVVSYLFLLIFILAARSICVAETQIPSTPLRGLKGLEKAIEIQQFTGKPIILWSTWNTCPNTRKVSKWFASSGVTNSLKDFPRVILESKGNEDEVRESEIRGFSGGNFYVIYDYYFDSYSSVWAWKKGTYKIKKDLLSQIKNKIK